MLICAPSPRRKLTWTVAPVLQTRIVRKIFQAQYRLLDCILMRTVEDQRRADFDVQDLRDEINLSHKGTDSEENI